MSASAYSSFYSLLIEQKVKSPAQAGLLKNYIMIPNVR